MIKTRITSEYPCCKGKVVLISYLDVPTEIYTRTCPECNFNWQITRVRQAQKGDTQIHKLIWQKEETFKYGG